MDYFWIIQVFTTLGSLFTNYERLFPFLKSKLFSYLNQTIINMFDSLAFMIFPYREYVFIGRFIITTFVKYSDNSDNLEMKHFNTFSEKMKIVLWYLNSNEHFMTNNCGKVLSIMVPSVNGELKPVNLFYDFSPFQLVDEKYGIVEDDGIYILCKLSDSTSCNNEKQLVVFNKDYELILRAKTKSGFIKLRNLLKDLEADYYKHIQTENNNALLCCTFNLGGNTNQSGVGKQLINIICEPFTHYKTMLNVITNFNQIIIDIINSHVISPSEEFIAHGNSRKCTFAFVGKPGTGKTSLIKAISHYTNRNVILIEINMFKSIAEMKKYIKKAEEMMFKINGKGSILVFEEFDCFIAKSRAVTTEKVLTLQYKEHMKFIKLNMDYNDYLSDFNDSGDSTKPESPLSEEVFDELYNEYKAINESKQNKSTIKLGDLLTFFDGVIENYNSISIITTNHPELMDKAFTRNKRIDLFVDLSDMPLDLFEKFYKFYFNQPLPADFVWPENIDIVPADIATYYNLSKTKFKNDADACSKEFLAMVLDHHNKNTTISK